MTSRRRFLAATVGAVALPWLPWRRRPPQALTFGSGVVAVLHGTEIVLTEAQVAQMEAWESAHLRLKSFGPITISGRFA